MIQFEMKGKLVSSIVTNPLIMLQNFTSEKVQYIHTV